MKLEISHTTRYAYDQPAVYALQQIRLRPMNSVLQSVDHWDVNIVGGKSELEFEDQHRNLVSLVSADRGVTSIEITARGQVDTHNLNGVLGPIYGPAPLWHYMQSTRRTLAGDGIRQFMKGDTGGSDMIARLHALSTRIVEAVPYGHAPTFVGTTAEEALEIGGGVCQDHAQIFVTIVRLMGIPARYVSGYLMIDDRIDQEASHAWAEAHIEGLGWVGFDVSNGISPDERYVRLACGLDSREAAPFSGMRVGPGDETMIVSLQVQQ